MQSSYDSSDSDSAEELANQIQKKPFQYDQFLSQSTDIFNLWTESYIQAHHPQHNYPNLVYLQKEFTTISQIEKFRTASIIRTQAFIDILHQQFVRINKSFLALYQPNNTNHNNPQTIITRLQQSRKLESQLRDLLKYLEVVMDQFLSQFYDEQKNLESKILQQLKSIFTFVQQPTLLWDVLAAESTIGGQEHTHHDISLGGSQAYYNNVLRSLLKRSTKLKEVHEGLMGELEKESLDGMKQSCFLQRGVGEVWRLCSGDRVEEKQKRDYLDCLKGVYFLTIGLNRHNTFYQYLFSSIHLEHLQTHRIFTDYQQLQILYVEVLQAAQTNPQYVKLVFTLDINKLPFQNRKLVPKPQLLILDIVYDYIAVAKSILNQTKIFPQIVAVPVHKGLASSQYMLQNQSINGLVGLMMSVMESSRSAFALGGIEVHRAYLRISDILKQIYLSYSADYWLFPSNILLYIPLRYFIDISEDIMADVKKALFQMVNAIGVDRLPRKVACCDGKVTSEKVSRAEYLQVILFFMEECRTAEQYLNLPEVLPHNLQTAVLYIRSLQARLGAREPTPDQKPYITTNLHECQKYKLRIDFKWFPQESNSSDRAEEFNIEKQFPDDWMRKIYRNTINLREARRLEGLFEKYRGDDSMRTADIVQMLKYDHGLDLKQHLIRGVREEDMFDLLDYIRLLLMINFDIFDLTLDEQISLSAMHVCLCLYNSNIKEAPGNEAYILIFQKILLPYIRHPNSSLTKFKNKYPAFFQKWLYSFQIGGLLSELGDIMEKWGSEAVYREDLINKVKMVVQFLDNKDQIQQNMTLQQLTIAIVTFSTTITPQSCPAVYLQAVELFCLFLNSFPAVKNETSLDFVLSADYLSDATILDAALLHVKQSNVLQVEEVSILNCLLKTLPDYMNAIGITKTFEVISTYRNLRGCNKDVNLDELTDKIISKHAFSFLQALLKLILLIKQRKEQREEQGDSQDNPHKEEKTAGALRELSQIFSQFYEKKDILEGIHLSEIVFIQIILSELQSKAQQPSQKQARNLFADLVKHFGTNEDLMFFAEKMELPELILCGQGREETLLIDLIVSNKHKEVQTELIKRLLRENRKLSDVTGQAIKQLSLQKEKVHSYHLNRFIQINSRYPHEAVQKFLIENIGCDRNSTPAKINQRYLINDLSKLLEKIPKRLCEELLLEPLPNSEREKLQALVGQIFEKLLYLPISRFENMDMKPVVEEPQEDEDWNTESEGEEETKEKKEKKQDFDSGSEVDEGIMAEMEGSSINDSSNEDLYDHPEFIDVFYNEDRQNQLHIYQQIIVLREELDVLIDGQYDRLQPANLNAMPKEIYQKIALIAKHMNGLQNDFSEQVAVKLPKQLYQTLKALGMAVTISPELEQKEKKRREPAKKAPKWMGQLFSDKGESDDSDIVQEDDSEIIEESDYNSYDSDDEFCDDDSEESIKEKKPKCKPKPRQFKEEPLPELLPTYSKIQGEISGSELKREEMTKLLEIALYSLLSLPESQVRTRHVTSLYMDILGSRFGQMFLESLLTVIRFDEGECGLKGVLEGVGHKYIGLQAISMQDTINNVLYLLQQFNEKGDKKEGNMLFRESGWLLPIAQEMIPKFNLPIQNNVITLLMIYIETNKARIRRKIASLNYQLQGDELGKGQKEYHLKKTQLKRIISQICRNGNSNQIWEVVEETMGLKVKQWTKLWECLKGYGSTLEHKVRTVGEKILQTLHNSESVVMQHGQHERLRSLENTYHIVSKLVSSCKEEIKQFYFINKEILREMVEEGGEYMDDGQIKKVPSILVKHRGELLSHSEMIRLCETMLYFIRLLRDAFQGKVQDKMLNKLLHYPKMVVETAWYYVFLFTRKQSYNWSLPSEIDQFHKKYPHIGSYQFNSLLEVFNLVLPFLSLESFCNQKFKQLFMPVLLHNSKLAQEISLRFKVPTFDEDVNTQNILVTRKCSFDMAFYQVVGEAISVEFEGEQGSDQGGLVRELMIGWKGQGVGEEAFFIGKILGISFKQGVPYGGALDIGMFVAITNHTPKIQFFEQIDPEIYRSLSYVRDNDPEDLCLRFTVEKLINGKLVEYQLLEGGKEIKLTQQNKDKYLEVYAAKYYYLGRERELREMQTGFNSVVFADYAQIFTPQEMLRQIRGEEIVDVQTLIKKASYEGYSAQSPIIKWFWEIVGGFDQERMNMFIQFVTGSPKITVYNSNFSITIEKVFEVNSLPVAHTCFNSLDLPEYGSKQILSSKLITAISEGNNSFGIL